jgi:hypothetical protein
MTVPGILQPLGRRLISSARPSLFARKIVFWALRDEVGEIRLVPPARRAAGPNASWVMAPFTHVNVLGSRFSDGTYGIYYAARHLETAIRETIHHFARFAPDANDPPRREDMRVLLGSIDRDLHDVSTLDDTVRVTILDKDFYTVSRLFGRDRRDAQAWICKLLKFDQRFPYCWIAG